MTNKILGGGFIDGRLGSNPNWSTIDVKTGRTIQSILTNGTVQYWRVEDTQKTGGELLAGGNYANPVSVAGNSLDNANAIKAILVSQGLSGDYGYFDDGFTVNDPLDVGIDASYQFWKYVGAETLPYDVPPLTDPSAGDWELVNCYSLNPKINPKEFGVVGDGVEDDTASWVSMEAQLNDFDVVDYSGLIVRFTSNVSTTNELVTHSNGCFLLDTCYFNLDVSNIDFENVRFKGVENLTSSDFTGSFLGGFDVAPAVSNGDAYYNKTENKVYIAKDGSWQKIYKEAGLRVVNSGGSNKDRMKFKSCKFNLLDEAFSCSSDSDSQDLYDFVGKCEFNKNGIGLKLNDPKRVDIGDSRASDNSCGIELNTDDYEGLGVTMSNAYINGNVFGLRGRGGLYDSTMTGNTFDHNRFLSILGGDISYGTGMELTVPVGRILRQLVFTGNNGRNNGDYSFVFIIDGAMDYCNIGGNASWLDDQDNILIDYSSGTAANNLLEGNRFLDGYNIIDNGTPWETNNAAFDAFNGGNIRGYLQLGTQLRLIPRTTTAFNSNEGNMTFLNGHTTLANGLYVNANVGQDGLDYKRIQTCEWYQTVNRPSGSSMPLNYSYWDTTLGKPVFRGAGGDYYTFDIGMITV